METFHLTPRQRKSLQKESRSTLDARVYKRAVALLALDRGVGATALAKQLGVCRATLYNWKDRYLACPNQASLRDRPGRGRHSLWTKERIDILEQALQKPPSLRGYHATQWTVPLLLDFLAFRTGLKLSDDTLRRQMHRMRYAWKRPRYVLQPDPQQKKKAQPAPSALPPRTWLSRAG